MANVIKHKRGSGSDPVANDLVVGEVAIRTDVGKLFTKMDNGSVAEIAGGGSDIAINTLSSSSGTGGGSATFNGSAYRFTLSQPPSVSAQQLLVSINGVIQKPVAGTGQPSEGFSVDGTDIILGDAPATGSDFFILTFKSLGVSEPADNSVTSAKIADGAIVNADINASAAIDVSKLSGVLPLAGGTLTGNLKIVSDTLKLFLGATEEMQVFHDGTSSLIKDTRDSGKVRIQADNFDFIDKDASGVILSATSSGLSVTGAITGTGDLTVDTNTLHVDSSNNRVGIGTTSPSDKLHTANAGNINTKIECTASGSGANAGLNLKSADGGDYFIQTGNAVSGGLRFFDATASSTRMLIDSSGRLLLGTTTEGNISADNLTVADSGDCGITIRSGTTNLGSIFFSDGTSGNAEFDAFIQYSHNNQKLFIGTGATGNSDVVIDSSGNVGVGTASPTRRLHVEQDANDDIATFINGDTTNGYGVNIKGGGSASGRYVLRLADGSNNDVMRVLANGNVGIGTTSPSVSLDIEATTPTIRLTDSDASGTPESEIRGGGGDLVFSADRDNEKANTLILFETDGAERMRITDETNKEIYFNGNTTLPGLANTNTGMSFETTLGSIFMSRNNASSLYVNVNGTGNQQLVSLRQNGTEVQNLKTQTMSYSSDEKVKKDIEALPIGLDFINKLEPKQFRYKFSEDTDPVSYGLIAQELEASLTSSGVTKDSALLCQYKALKETDNKDTSEYWVDYTKMIPVLIKAVQELTAKLEALEAN